MENATKMAVFSIIIGASLASTTACGDGGTEADRLGVAAECTATSDCNTEDGLVCLSQFKGGYCGKSDCTKTTDCPGGSVCITHDDTVNYCFRTCIDKVECNINRTAANEANCSSNVTFAEGSKSGKVCIPPSGS